jgi:hypothetical protein
MSRESEIRGQGFGARYSLPAMIKARDLTFEAVNRIAAGIHPGMTEGRSHDLAQEILVGMGMERLWHRNVIRFGPGTLETFKGDYQPDYVLKDRDIFFVDLGVVWDGHEGDAGDTFVVGDDAGMMACAQAARILWHEVAGRWRDGGLSGRALYEYALRRAGETGWVLNWDVKGHRVSDYPHKLYRDGPLRDFEERPVEGLWILEIQIAHPSRPFGAFYEDLLYRPDLSSEEA